MILEVKYLRLVEAIATYGTLTNAGKHLHLTQSALSHQLNELERRLATPLFHRVGRRLVPTLAGERVLDSAKRTLAVLRETEAAIRRIAAGQEAVLRVTTECYTAYHWLPAIIERFAERCPKVEVQIVAEASRRPIEALFRGKVDVAIIPDSTHDDRLESIPLFEDDMVVLVAPGHRLARLAFVDPEEFADEHLIGYSALTRDSTLFMRYLKPAGVVPRRVSVIQLTEAIIELVKAGLGVSVLARWAVEPHLRSGSLVAVPFTREGYRRQWTAAILKQPATPLHIHEFCKLMSSGPSALSSLAGFAGEPSAARLMRRAT